jgi:N-acetyltransferase
MIQGINEETPGHPSPLRGEGPGVRSRDNIIPGEGSGVRFPDNLVLEDERAILRPMQSDDLSLLQPFSDNEPDLWKFSLVSPTGPGGMENYIRETLKLRNEKKEYPFIIIDKRTRSVAGSSRFYDIQLNNLTTQLGYTWYGKNFQRSGLNRHCKMLMLEYAFETWGMERVEFRADVNNRPSVEAMKAIGCVVEGVLRSNVVWRKGRRDSIVLSILKKEWDSGVKEGLKNKIQS